MLTKFFKDLFQEKNSTIQPLRILVIEDTEIDRVLARKTLEKNGYVVLTANDGKAGIDAVREHKPDIIILDFMLPDLNGPDICHVLKNDDLTKDIPIIFLTSQDNSESVVDSFDQGADYYLTKPFQAKELLRTVEHSIADRTE